MPGEKSAVGQMYLLFCLTGSKKMTETSNKLQYNERVCVCFRKEMELGIC